MSKLYRQAKTFKTELFKVSPLHTIYLEQSGNPKEHPVIHLHGGPGSASKPRYRKKFNPDKYWIIQFDQRGSGKSKPLGETKENTTWDLVGDIEKIRKYLKIEKWVVSGGSWGSVLALAYAEKYPKSVKALILRGIFTYRKWEMEWLTKWGANLFFPDKWEPYENFIPKTERGNLTKAYAKRILGGDKKAAQISVNWEHSLLSLLAHKTEAEKFTEKDFAGAKIFYHYETNKGFLKDGQLIKNASKLKGIPGVIIQGRYDMICPPLIAWQLHKAWPKSEIVFVSDAGHSGDEKATGEKIVEYADKFGK